MRLALFLVSSPLARPTLEFGLQFLCGPNILALRFRLFPSLVLLDPRRGRPGAVLLASHLGEILSFLGLLVLTPARSGIKPFSMSKTAGPLITSGFPLSRTRSPTGSTGSLTRATKTL